MITDHICLLTEHLKRLTNNDDDYQTLIPRLSLHRRHTPSKELKCIYSLGLTVVLQGEKQLLFNEQVSCYSAGHCLLTAIDLPVISHVSKASSQQPFLALVLTFDPQTIIELANDMALTPPTKNQPFNPIHIYSLEQNLANCLLRLVKLLDEPPMLRQHLAPLIEQEIIIRLLSGAQSLQLRHLLAIGSPNQQIAKALSWFKHHYMDEIVIDDLAHNLHMSPSTFRHHFRNITGISPLQYQKQLRLQEARQLMLNKQLDASHAANLVGYESASQFSREYSRFFGEPPQRDIKRMRHAI